MTEKQFIEELARLVKKHAPRYDICVYSPIIAQGILESAKGTSELAVHAKNVFGLKYNPKQPNRCPSASGTYIKVGSEQNADGSYTSSTMLWQRFDSLEDCVIGYLDFINIPRYANLKGVTDPKTYLENIKADGYATSINYVENLMNVISKYNLTQYDEIGVNNMKFTNSPLVNYIKISPNKTPNRNHEIDTITIHCVVGQVTVERLGEIFAEKSKKASSNYGIGKDGKIGMYVEEKDRSFCSSNEENDQRAVTIEVASDTKAPYAVTDAAYSALIKLVADICRRNNIKELKWKGDKSLIGQVDKQNMTVHRWFAKKSCPGEFLYERHDDIAAKVNALLNPSTNTSTDEKVLYRIQVGAFSKKDNCNALFAKVKAAGFDACIVQVNGLYKIQIGAYSKKENSDAMLKKVKAAGFDAIITTAGGQTVSSQVKEIKVGSTVKVKKGAKTYTGGNLAAFVYERNHQVKQINVDRVVITYQGTVITAVKKSDLTLVE